MSWRITTTLIVELKCQMEGLFMKVICKTHKKASNPSSKTHPKTEVFSFIFFFSHSLNSLY